jgi:hypothetical protein
MDPVRKEIAVQIESLKNGEWEDIDIRSFIRQPRKVVISKFYCLKAGHGHHDDSQFGPGK